MYCEIARKEVTKNDTQNRIEGAQADEISKQNICEIRIGNNNQKYQVNDYVKFEVVSCIDRAMVPHEICDKIYTIVYVYNNAVALGIKEVGK